MEKKKRRNRASSTIPMERTQLRKEKGDIPLNAETARQAIILSEIIGRPVSKRKRQR